MKSIKLFAAALAATTLLAASCTEVESSNNNGNTDNGDKTYAGVNITLPAKMGKTRAEDKDAGIDTEKTVTEIGVFIVDKNSSRLDYKFFEVNETNFTTVTENDRTVYKGKVVVQTVTGIKKVYVVANPTSNLKTKLGASGATAMNSTAYGSPKADFLTGTLTSMVMTGEYTLNSGDLDMTDAKDAAEALETANVITIDISRNLAKVVLQQETGYTVTGGTTTLEWTVVNEAKDAYFIKKASTLFSTFPSGAHESTSHIYWTNFTDDATYIPVLVKGDDAKTAAYANSKYVFENMPQSFYEGNTTAARIKGKFIPATVYNGVTNGVPVVDASFTTAATFLRSKIDGTYWTQAGAAAAAVAGYNGHSTASLAADFLTYTNGVGYYTIYVKDESGSKGVLRNNYYLMQIKEVRGPGSPAEPADPTVPIDEDTNLVTNVVVLNWDFRKSVHDIQ